jgi:hypothetical protein
MVVDDVRSPAKIARAPSTTWRKGLNSDTVSNHDGARLIGSRIPDNSRIGSAMPLRSGASASSLLSVNATA